MNGRRHEFELIEWIRRQTSSHDRIGLGIGDDTALLRFPQPADCLVTVDMLMEGAHFTMPTATAAQVGRKALGVNLSDIAAMAGRPLAAVISLALPRGRGEELTKGLYAGIFDLARQFDVAIAGGDTNSWTGPLVISITVLGETTGRGAVTRGGAQPGDVVMVTGALGGSLAGRHLDFTPRVDEALALHAAVELHAMIDLSDGLSRDVRHIVEQSGVGVIIDQSAIPVSDAARAIEDGRTPLEHALGDGEDFELLFMVDPADAETLLKDPPIEIPLAVIGEVVEGADVQIRTPQGDLRPLGVTGWQHEL